MREIRMLRAMWRALETGLRKVLNGHEGGNAGYSQGSSYESTRQRSTLPTANAITFGAPSARKVRRWRPLSRRRETARPP